MKTLLIFAILLQVTSVFTARRRLLHAKIQAAESFPAPTTHDNSLTQITAIFGLVVGGTTNPVNALSNLETILNARPPEGFVVILNASNKTVKFEGCPENGFTRVFISCLTETIAPGKSSFVMKQHGFLTNDEILLKADGEEIGHMNEGYFYAYVNGKIQIRGTYEDWHKGINTK